MTPDPQQHRFLDQRMAASQLQMSLDRDPDETGEWIEALEAGFAPQLALRATHISAIEHLSMEVLLKYAVDADGYVYEPPNDDD